MGRRNARESTMKLLYQMEINSDFTDGMINAFIENNSFQLSESEYIRDAVNAILKNLKQIDCYIQKHIDCWELHRLAKIDLCILRIAIYEIVYREDIPIQVSINEAIEIGKIYSTDESAKFINGVLGGFIRSRDDNG